VYVCYELLGVTWDLSSSTETETNINLRELYFASLCWQPFINFVQCVCCQLWYNMLWILRTQRNKHGRNKRRSV